MNQSQGYEPLTKMADKFNPFTCAVHDFRMIWTFVFFDFNYFSYSWKCALWKVSVLTAFFSSTFLLLYYFQSCLIIVQVVNPLASPTNSWFLFESPYRTPPSTDIDLPFQKKNWSSKLKDRFKRFSLHRHRKFSRNESEHDLTSPDMCKLTA